MKKVLPVILPACFMLAGCRMSSDNSNRQDLNECPQVAELRQVNTHKVVVCDPHLFKDTVILPLSHFTEELQIVKLENTAEALVSESPVIIGNHHILVNMRWSDKTPYRLFDKSGRFITNIGTFGKGPNEYMYISDQQLDEKNGRIFLLPVNSKKILVYDLNGNSYDPIPLPYQSSRSRIYVDQADSTLSVITLPLRDSRFAAPYFAWMQKLSGKIINGISSKGFELEGKHVLGGFFQIFSGNNTPEKDFLIFSFIPRKDTLYHYDMEGNRLIPQFTVDFKDNQIPIHVYWELPHHYMGDLSESEEVQPRQWTTKNHKYYVLEKATLKGAYFKLKNDFLGDIEIESPFITFSDGYYAVNYEPANLLDKLENALTNKKMSVEMREKLTDLKNSINETDNNYILYAKLKQ